MSKTQLGPTTQLFPMPALLVAVKAGEEATAVLTVAWAGVVSGSPPTLAIEIGAGHYSTPFIEQERCFSVNVPSSDMVVGVDYCGMISGKKDADKIGTCGWTVIPGQETSASIIAESPLAFECRLVQEVPAGKGRFYLAEIVETHVNADLVSNGKVDASRLDPLVFTPDGAYYALGERLASAWDAGKALVDKG